MDYAICTVAAAPVRKEDAHRSEMTNQLLFGETMQILEQKGEWYRIRSIYDDYEGWLTHHLISEIGAFEATSSSTYVATGLTNPVTLPDQLINAPMGSSLTGFDEETRLLWDEKHKYHGTYRNMLKPFNEDLLDNVLQAWINAPYLWGGRTFMGVDCSGFCQVVFKVLGIQLKRDAYQQAEQGDEVKSLEASRKGDLAFFNNDQGRIIHVGILLDANTIVHASGKVKVDTIDKNGIISRETGKRTHQLYSMRRCF